MRKVIWCCSAAGVLTAGSFLSLAYYACHCPDSFVGRSMQVMAEASVAMEPLYGITSLAMRTSRANAPAHETTALIDECIPDDPQPVALDQTEELPEPKEVIEPDAAPIVISEQNFDVEATPPVADTSSEIADMQDQEIPPKGGPITMPYCRDDEEEPATPPRMPRTDAEEEMKHSVFKEWMKLFEGNNTTSIEELPPPKELEPQTDPKCQEDLHLHEQYPGCPRTSCPYTRKKGSEESSEEPQHPGTKPKQSKDCKDKEECPRTKGVDTMEYRKSDAGLYEYGPGQIH